MQYLSIIEGDLLESKETFIAHQCNCVSTDSKGFAKTIFSKYPFSNSYTKRIRGKKETYSEPGSIEIFNNGEKCIINMYAQYYPSASKYSNDTKTKRIEWFINCLDNISKISDIKSKIIAMPFHIGCGLAGGDWNVYYNIIEEFANKEEIQIVLYKMRI